MEHTLSDEERKRFTRSARGLIAVVWIFTLSFVAFLIWRVIT